MSILKYISDHNLVILTIYVNFDNLCIMQFMSNIVVAMYVYIVVAIYAYIVVAIYVYTVVAIYVYIVVAMSVYIVVAIYHVLEPNQQPDGVIMST